jgi:hypothetical protein
MRVKLAPAMTAAAVSAAIRMVNVSRMGTSRNPGEKNVCRTKIAVGGDNRKESEKEQLKAH